MLFNIIKASNLLKIFLDAMKYRIFIYSTFVIFSIWGLNRLKVILIRLYKSYIAKVRCYKFKHCI